MLGRRSLRFVVEAGILVAVAASVAVAGLRPLLIAVLMVFAWAIVSLLEWASMHRESHYERGLPPRYYVPQVQLPAPVYVGEAAETQGPEIAPPPAILEPVSWFDVELPGSEPIELPVLPEPEADEVFHHPVVITVDPPAAAEAEPEPDPALLHEPEPDYALLAERIRAAPVPDASWFDSELPGAAAVEPPPEAAWLREDDVAFLAAEPPAAAEREQAPAEPETEAEPALEPEAVHEEAEPVDYGRLAAELRSVQPEQVGWFDVELPGAAPEPVAEAFDVDVLFEQALEEFAAAEPVETQGASEPTPAEPDEPEWSPEPVDVEAVDDVEIDYKLLFRQLDAGEPVLATWFDTELPGSSGDVHSSLAPLHAVAEPESPKHFWQRPKRDA